MGSSGKGSSAKKAAAQSVLGLVVRGVRKEKLSSVQFSWMFPQPSSGSRAPQSLLTFTPRGILGGDVAGPESLGGFPEPAALGGELGLAAGGSWRSGPGLG